MADVAAFDPNGRKVWLPEGEVEKALAAGFRLETATEAKERAQEEKFGDRTGAAFLAGAGRGATLGLSDLTLKGLGLVSPETLKGLETYNPEASTAGEVTGAIGAALVPGGQFTAAGMAARGASAVERATAKVLGEKLLAQTAARAAGGVVEGSLYGAGRALTESAMGDSELTAEKVIAHAGMGAVLGAAGAGATALVERGAKAAAKGAGRVLEAAELKLPTAENFVLRDLQLTGSQVGKLQAKGLGETAPRALLDDPRYAAAKHLDEKLGLIRTKKEEAGLAISDHLSRFDAIANPSERVMPATVADRVRRELIAPLEDGPAGNASIISRLEKELEALEKMGDRGITFAKANDYKIQLDKFINHEAASRNPVAENLRQLRGILNDEMELRAGLVSARTGTQKELHAPWLASKKEYGGMAQLEKQVAKRLGDRDGNRVISLTDYITGAAAVGGSMDGNVDAGDLATGAVFALGNKWARERLPQIMALTLDRLNRSGSLNRVAKGFAGAVESTLKKTPELFGPFGAILANASARGHEELFMAHAGLAETSPAYRDTMAAAGFPVDETPEERDAHGRRAGNILAMEGALAQRDEKTRAAMAGLFSGSPVSLRKERGRKELEERVEELSKLVSDPDELARRLNLGETFSETAPGVATAVAATTSRAVAFLHSKAPKSPFPPTVKALAKPWKPSDQEFASFERYVEAVEDPDSVIEDLSRGHVPREGLEALRAVYPKLFADLQVRLTEEASKAETRLDYQRRLTLGQVLGVDVDDSTSPQRLAIHQAAHAAPTAADAPAPAPGRPMKLPESQTQSQRLESRGAA